MSLELGPYELRLLTVAGTYTLMVLGYQFIFGHAGALSLAQATFFGLGAYVTVLASPESDPGNLLVLLLAAVAAGCSDKVTSVDSSFTTPEGTPSADARMIVTPDVAITWNVARDINNNGDPFDDPVIATDSLHRIAAGAVSGVILDRTVATRYQLLRREENGGLHALEDFVHSPRRQWLETQWEAYTFDDPMPTPGAVPSYIGRGLIGGTVTASSPLTNDARISSPTIDNIPASVVLIQPDSTMRVSWDAVPGAAGYWIQEYQFISAPAQEVLRSTFPAPFYLGLSRDYTVIFRRDNTPYNPQVPFPASEVVVQRPKLPGLFYNLRITAVDSTGQVIAMTRGPFIGAPGQNAGEFLIFRLGALFYQYIVPTRRHLAASEVATFVGSPGPGFLVRGRD